MCLGIPKIDTSAQEEAMKQQLNKNNALLSTEQTASTAGEKTNTKRTITSLRVPLKGKNNTSTTGVNTVDTTTGLNIPL